MGMAMEGKIQNQPFKRAAVKLESAAENGVKFEEITRNMLFIEPALLLCRVRVLSYFQELETQGGATPMFHWKLELEKEAGGKRKMLKNFGFNVHAIPATLAYSDQPNTHTPTHTQQPTHTHTQTVHSVGIEKQNGDGLSTSGGCGRVEM